MDEISRRTFLSGVAGLGVAGVTAGAGASPPAASGGGPLDEALALFAKTGPEYGGGLANHGPMAAEALATMGRASAIVPWAERYRRHLDDPPRPRMAIPKQGWQAAMGDISRVGDWIAFFDRELAEHPWREALETWTARLAPGVAAVAFHGLLRTAHAARSLSAHENPVRLHALAEGLAYWTARQISLGGEVGGGSLSPSRALAVVEALPAKERPRGMITDAVAAVAKRPEFAGVGALVDVSDPLAFLSNLTETFAGVFLANAPRTSLIAFLHTVTGPSSVRLLLPHVSPGTGRLLLGRAWQAAAAVHTAFRIPGAAVPPETGPLDSAESLVDRAVAAGDEHAIKLTDACLREYALNPKPIYLRAARFACDRLG